MQDSLQSPQNLSCILYATRPHTQTILFDVPDSLTLSLRSFSFSVACMLCLTANSSVWASSGAQIWPRQPPKGSFAPYSPLFPVYIHGLPLDLISPLFVFVRRQQWPNIVSRRRSGGRARPTYHITGVGVGAGGQQRRQPPRVARHCHRHGRGGCHHPALMASWSEGVVLLLGHNLRGPVFFFLLLFFVVVPFLLLLLLLVWLRVGRSLVYRGRYSACSVVIAVLVARVLYV